MIGARHADRPADATALAAIGVTRRRTRGAEVVVALDRVDLHLHLGEVTVLAGPSGSGKTTLLSVLAGMERPDEGQVHVGPPLQPNAEVALLPWSELALVPQAPSLLDELPLRENVDLAVRLAPAGWQDGDPAAAATTTTVADTDELLDRLAIGHLGGRYPTEVSGGEQQRAALARALRLRPTVLLADEPTAHQDRFRTDLVMTALVAHARSGASVVVASHASEVIEAADRVVEMEDGRVIHDRKSRT